MDEVGEVGGVDDRESVDETSMVRDRFESGGGRQLRQTPIHEILLANS
jgi:hypothetical protein